MNANGAAAAAYDDGSLQRDQCEMLLRTLMGPEESSSPCTRWWVEELLAAAAEESRCGEEPEVVEDYVAWLSEEHLRELDALERRAQAQAAAQARAADRHRGSEHPERHSTGSEAEREEDKKGEAEVWFEHMEHAMDAWAEVVRAKVDHANGVVRSEEYARDSDPYADWDGPTAFCSQADFPSGDYFGGVAW
ncbi:hypothetical protein VTO73DRAFT_10177 [Trametes versicolor]